MIEISRQVNLVGEPVKLRFMRQIRVSRSITILFVQSVKERCLAAEMDDFVTKTVVEETIQLMLKNG
jgi:hypothetical protein